MVTPTATDPNMIEHLGLEPSTVSEAEELARRPIKPERRASSDFRAPNSFYQNDVVDMPEILQ